MNPINLFTKAAADCQISDIVFDEATGLKVDLYYPESYRCDSRPEKVAAKVQYPTIIFVHGGSWQSGTKEMYGPVGAQLAKLGYVVAVPQYRLYPNAVYPEFIKDLERFVLWFSEYGADYSMSTKNVQFMAHSAGAFNVADYLFNKDYQKPLQFKQFVSLAGPHDFFLPTTSPKFAPIFNVRGANNKEALPVFKLYTQDADSNLANTSAQGAQSLNNSATNAIREGESTKTVERVILLHGEDDDTVAPENLITFHEALRAQNIPSFRVLYRDTGHVGIVTALSGLPLTNSVILSDVEAFVKAGFRVSNSGPEDESYPEGVITDEHRIVGADIPLSLDTNSAFKRSAIDLIGAVAAE